MFDIHSSFEYNSTVDMTTSEISGEGGSPDLRNEEPTELSVIITDIAPEETAETRGKEQRKRRSGSGKSKETRIFTAGDATLARAYEKGAQDEIDIIVNTLEALRKIAQPLEDKAFEEAEEINPANRRSPKSTRHRIVGSTLLTAARRVRNQGIDNITVITLSKGTKQDCKPLADVSGDEVTDAVVSALSNGMFERLSRSDDGARRTLFHTDVDHVYVVVTTHLKSTGKPKTAEIVAATPAYIRTQRPPRSA